MVKLPNWMLRSDLREDRLRRPMEFESFARRAILAYLGIQGALAAILLIDFGALRVVQPVLSFCWSLVKRLLFFAILSLIGLATAEASPCTKGVDCYCDRVQGGNLNDPQVLLCEDFEAPTLRASTPVGGGAPYWGPPFDDTGQTNNRGVNGYWQRKYNNGVGAGLWTQGNPASPTFGRTCGFPLCSGTGIYDPADRWQANGFAFTGFPTSSEFNAEIGTIVPPSGSAGGGSGAFDGTASKAHRIIAAGTGGTHGSVSFGAAKFLFGITMAIAYPNNSNASGIWAAPWKHNEWHVTGTGGGGDGLFLFHNQGSRSEQSPFRYMFTFARSALGLPNSDTQATCQTKLNAATKTVGDFFCDGGGSFNYGTSAAAFTRTTDWPDSTWACVRGFYDFATTGAIKLWFTGPAGVEKVIVDISGMDFSGQSAANGYNELIWNNYANVNQPGAGPVTTQTTYRYEDNIHIRAGQPVSCPQIGYAGSVLPPPPSNPPPSAPTAIWGHRGTDILRGVRTSGGLIRGLVLAGSMIPLPIFIIGAVVVKRRRGKKESSLP
jgi:hypothetical protein